MNVGTLQIQMEASMARLSADIRQGNTMISGFARQTEQALAGVRTAFAALGVGLSAGAFIAMIKGAIDAADHLNDLSKSTDIAVEKLAGLRLLAKQSGGDLDGMAASINKLSQNIGKDADKFKALGVTAKEPLEAFKQLSDVFVSIQDPQLRAAVAAQALGKSWASAAPALSEGGQRIGEIVEKGERLSGITKDMAVNADEFNDKMAELNTTLGATRTKLVAEMLPGMNEVASAMREAAKEGGLLMTAWVGLGGVMANILGLTDSQKTRGRLREINDQLAITGKRIAEAEAAGGRLPSQIAPRFDVTLEQLLKMRTALEAERTRLAPPEQPKPVPNPAAAAAAAARARAFVKEAGSASAAEAVSPFAKMMNALLEEELKLKGELTAVDKLALDIGKMKLAEFEKLTIAEQVELHFLASSIDLLNQAKVARDAYVKTMEADAALEQEIADIIAARATKEGDAIKAQHEFLEGMRFEASLIGKSNVERETAIALRALEKSGIDKTSTEYERLTAKIREEIQAKSAAEALNPKTLEQMRFELKLISMTNVEREQAIALRALELTGIDQTTDAYKDYVAQLKSIIAAKTAAEEMKQAQIAMWQDIDRVAHDTFASIFDSGKSAFDRLRDTLKNGLYSLLYQLTIRPILINIATTVGGVGVAQAAFPGAASGGGAGGIGNLLSGVNSASNLFSGGGIGASLFGSAGAYAAAVPGLTSAAVGSQAAMLAAQTGVFGAAGLGATMSAGGGAAGAAMTAIGTAMPYIGIALAAASMLGLFGGKKTSAVGTGYTFAGGYSGASGLDLSLTGQTNVGPHAMPSGGHIAPLTAEIDKALAELKTLSQQFGFDTGALSTGRAGFSVTSSKVGQAGEAEAYQLVVREVVEGIAKEIVPGLENFRKENEGLIDTFKRIGLEVKLVDQILEIVGKETEAVFDGLVEAAIRMRDELITLMGGLDAATALASSYYQNFFTEAERLATDLGRVNDAMHELGLTALPATREEFRRLVEAQDLSAESGREMFAALMQIAPAFAAVTQSLEDAAVAANTLAGQIAGTQSEALKAISDQISASRSQAATARQAADGYRQITVSLQEAIDRIRGTSGSGANLQALFGTAMTGDADALRELPGAAQDFLAAARGRAGSEMEFRREEAGVLVMLEQARMTSDAMVNWNEYQASLLTTQVNLLEDIKSTLEMPTPDLDLLKQQQAMLQTIGGLLEKQTIQIVSGDEMQAVLMTDQTGKIVLNAGIHSGQLIGIGGAALAIDQNIIDQTATQSGQLVGIGNAALNQITALDGQTLEIVGSNLLLRDHTGKLISANELLKDQSGQISIGNALMVDQTGNIVAGNTLQDAIRALSDEQLASLLSSTDILKHVQSLSAEQLEGIFGSRAALGAIWNQDAALADRQSGQLVGIGNATLDQNAQLLGIGDVTMEQLQTAMTSEQVLNNVRGLNDAQLSALVSSDTKLADVRALNDAQLGSLLTSAPVLTKIQGLTEEQLGAVFGSWTALGAIWNQDAILADRQSGQLVGIGNATLTQNDQLAGIGNVTMEQLSAALTSKQVLENVRGLNNEQLTALVGSQATLADVRALDDAQLSSLLSTAPVLTNIQGLSAEQLGGIFGAWNALGAIWNQDQELAERQSGQLVGIGNVTMEQLQAALTSRQVLENVRGLNDQQLSALVASGTTLADVRALDDAQLASLLTTAPVLANIQGMTAEQLQVLFGTRAGIGNLWYQDQELAQRQSGQLVGIGNATLDQIQATLTSKQVLDQIRGLSNEQLTELFGAGVTQETIKALTQTQTQQVITGNATQDVIRNITALDASYSAEMVRALVAGEISQTISAAQAVTLLQQLVDLIGNRDVAAAAEAAQRAIEDAARAAAAAEAAAARAIANARQSTTTTVTAAMTGAPLGFDAWLASAGYGSTWEDYGMRYNGPAGNLAQSEIDAMYQAYLASRSHASGGIGMGWSLVGEEGPELVNFSAPGRVYTAAETYAALGGGADVVAELAAVRTELVEIKANTRASAFTGHKTSRQLERWDGDGMPPVRA